MANNGDGELACLRRMRDAIERVMAARPHDCKEVDAAWDVIHEEVKRSRTAIPHESADQFILRDHHKRGGTW